MPRQQLADARLTAETLGHAGLASVAGYTRISERRRRQALEGRGGRWTVIFASSAPGADQCTDRLELRSADQRRRPACPARGEYDDRRGERRNRGGDAKRHPSHCSHPPLRSTDGRGGPSREA